MQFKDIVDQDTNIKILKGLISFKKFKQPIMLTGFSGAGKTTLARVYAKTILCKNRSEALEPCNTCDSCKSFLSDSHISYLEIDAASNGGVDDIKQLKEDSFFKSLGECDFRIVVIDECHAMSNQANKALFKQLEDNTQNQIYIFCTTEPDSMAPEIRSRCFELPINKVSKEALLKRLQEICLTENIEFEEKALELIATVKAPNVRNAIKTLDYLHHLGKITKVNVENHLGIDKESAYLTLLHNIKTNMKQVFSDLEDLLKRETSRNIYEGLIENTLKCLKLKYDLNYFFNDNSVLLARNILGIYRKEELLIMLDVLSHRNIYADRSMLEADLYIIHQEIQIENTDKKPNSGESGPTNYKPMPKKDNPVNTAEILERYKAFSPEVALMMHKCKNSTLKNTEVSVKLLQDVIDYKKNISKMALKKLLETGNKT